MNTIKLVFPHQLFQVNPLGFDGRFILVEEFLFYKQYAFHKQKLAFHRASMTFYADFLADQGAAVTYVQSQQPESDIRILIVELAGQSVSKISVVDPEDDWLMNRLAGACSKAKIDLVIEPSPQFLNSKPDVTTWMANHKRLFHADFYSWQRKKWQLLLDEKDKPVGGKWSFDAENRKKYPRQKTPPAVQPIPANAYYEEARGYVETHFSNNPGTLREQPTYPTTFDQAEVWLHDFLNNRFAEFGPYEDAIVREESILNHSVLTPMLNAGLLTPQTIIDAAIQKADQENIPLNSLEGFIRQIIGWREFIRGLYAHIGSKQRTQNFFGFSRKIPPSFYNGTTGILPVDETIKKVKKSGYAHHIERLMVLGNFMLLCEFDPNEVYRWFMELFIDAYDWVMVPNVYGMSQFADGGLMATKPYISGSNYIMKMSNYPKGEWQAVWDGLFWRFMVQHHAVFANNPRMNMLLNTYRKMTEAKQKAHMQNAERFLQQLDNA